MERNITLDIAKGLCILLVVIGHYVPESAPGWYMWFVDFVYTFHMPLFMWISGFLYVKTLRNENYGQFIMRKLKRLMIPYLVVSVIIITFKLVSQRYMPVDNPVGVEAFVRALYLPEAGFFMWFLWALMLIFLIVPFFRTPAMHLVLLAVSIVLALLVPLEFTEMFCLRQAVSFLPYFSFGACMADVSASHNIARVRPWPALLISVACFAGIILWMEYGERTRAGVMAAGFIGIVGGYLLCHFINSLSIGKGWLMIVGECSFTIYLFHTTVEGVFKGLLSKAGLFSAGHIAAIIIVVVAGVLIPIALHLCVLRRYGVTRKIFGIRKVDRVR